MKRLTIWLFISIFIVSIFLYPKSTQSAPYYQGKVISIVVAFPPGGGYDRMARFLAKHLPKHIPGNPSIIVQNMGGAGSLIGTNYLYSKAKPDGLTIGTFNRNLPFAQLLKQEGVRFDLSKFSWIGSPSVEATVLSIRSDLPYKTFEQVLNAKEKEPIILGHTGPATNSYQFPALLKEFAGLRAKWVRYAATADVTIAIERNEVNAYSSAYSSLRPFIDRGLVHSILRGRVSEPGIENLPINEDLTNEKTGKTLMAILSAVDYMGRPFVAPPGTPAEIMKILRDAFDKMAKNPEAIAESENVMMRLQYVNAEKCLELINYVLNQPSDIATEFGKYIKF